MKKALWIPALILLFFLGDRLGAWLLQQLVEKSQFRYARLYNDNAEADILLLGNSRGLIFYQPFIEKITGKSTFNLSYNALPIDIGRVLVEDYLNRYPPPQQLLIDVTMCDRINHSLASGFSPFRQYSTRLDGLINKNANTSWWAGNISHLYRFNGEIFQRSLNYIGKTDKDWLIDRIINEHLQSNVHSEPIIELNTNAYLLEELRKVINLAEQKGVEVKLLINPYYPPYAERLYTLNQFIEKIESSTGKAVKNYAAALHLKEGFGDYQHLNKKGSKQYISLLAEDGVLKMNK